MNSKQQSQFDKFLEAYFQELVASPDEEMLADRNPGTLQPEVLKMLESAQVEAGQRRLAKAKRRIAQLHKLENIPLVSAAEARTYLRQAANDSRFTLAARKLTELSDEEAILLYAQLKELESKDNETGIDPA